MTDLRALAAGICSEQERLRCEVEAGEMVEWSCAHCPKARPEDLHAYTLKLLWIRTLRRAGYPLAADDLTCEEWVDLGRLEQCLQTPPPSGWS